MGRLSAGVASALLLVAAAPAARAQDSAGRLRLRLDASEAEAVLAIVQRQAAGRVVADSDWQRLFSTEPYRRLAQREASMGRTLTDSAFEAFVLSGALAARADSLRRTLRAWESADLTAAAGRAFAYLPPDATIRATVYPVIKPQSNSFVFEPRTDPAIFLFLDPASTAAEFQNTVAHELHHIGYASVSARGDSAIASLPPGARLAARWVGAFGEGFAMLAAAGGPDVSPHAESPPADRERWDRDVAHFNDDLPRVQAFLLDLVHGRLPTEEARDSAGYGFFGVQGPWYTVGWKMAVTIEKRFGRARLVQCMLDPRQVLAWYNRAAAEQNARGGPRLALWSPELLASLEVAGGK